MIYTKKLKNVNLMDRRNAIIFGEPTPTSSRKLTHGFLVVVVMNALLKSDTLTKKKNALIAKLVLI